MADNGQTAVAWEMLSSVVAMRAKARENKLPKLLSSLHGVEVELARIIAGAEAPQDAAINSSVRSQSAALAAATGHIDEIYSDDDTELKSEPAPAPRARSGRRGGRGPRGDQQLRAYAKKYLAITQQLKELVERGEAAATGDHFGDALDEDWEAESDALLSDQHELSFTIAGLKATTFEGLVDKAAVLDDLIEENTDDPVQVLARSLVRDVITMGQNGKAGR